MSSYARVFGRAHARTFDVRYLHGVLMCMDDEYVQRGCAHLERTVEDARHAWSKGHPLFVRERYRCALVMHECGQSARAWRLVSTLWEGDALDTLWRDNQRACDVWFGDGFLPMLRTAILHIGAMADVGEEALLRCFQTIGLPVEVEEGLRRNT